MGIPLSNLEHPLELRCQQFAKEVRLFCRMLKHDIENVEDIRQLIRSSGSVGANYIEANEHLGTQDFKMRLKISRKEAKESVFFLELLETFGNLELQDTQLRLSGEANQLKRIFSSMLLK
ncbi:MAG: four helix bundle protein [Bacteroidota bacterium]